jgi:hypothetical protein
VQADERNSSTEYDNHALVIFLSQGGATGRVEVEDAMFDLAAHGIKDIDAAEMHDPNNFGAYAPQIYGYFKAMEVRA